MSKLRLCSKCGKNPENIWGWGRCTECAGLPTKKDVTETLYGESDEAEWAYKEQKEAADWLEYLNQPEF